MDEIHLGEITVANLVRVVPDGAATGPMPTTEAANNAGAGFAEPSPDEDGLRTIGKSIPLVRCVGSELVIPRPFGVSDFPRAEPSCR